MDTEKKRILNKDYVLTLVEEKNHRLEVKEYDIKSSNVIEEEIKAIMENPNKTSWDLYSKIQWHIDGAQAYNLCYPHEYDESFIDPSERPKDITYEKYMKALKEIENAVRMQYGASSISIQRKIEEQKIKQEIEWKNSLALKAIRYIRCMNLSDAFKKVSKDESVKMYSSDNIGWTSFNYKINDDIQVAVDTNFAYGGASYFFIAVKYKDFVIIPYSDLVHYYYANMKNLISYTRSYVCKRDSWHFALDFVADFVNKSLDNPIEFIKEYIVTEVEEMIKGLRATIKNPKEVLERIKRRNVDQNISMRVIRPFLNYDNTLFEMLPEESISVFKAEKISGALLFLDSLKGIEYLCPPIIPVIDEIIEMNRNIHDEVKTVINSINIDLKPLQVEWDANEEKIDNLDKKIENHKEILRRLQKDKSYEVQEKIEEKYKKRHPRFVQMMEERDELRQTNNELSIKISRRNNLKDRMEECLERILNECFNEAS